MRKNLEKTIMPSTSIFKSSIFGAPTRLEPTGPQPIELRTDIGQVLI
jgi:hypothetical protein